MSSSLRAAWCRPSVADGVAVCTKFGGCSAREHFQISLLAASHGQWTAAKCTVVTLPHTNQLQL